MSCFANLEELLESLREQGDVERQEAEIRQAYAAGWREGCEAVAERVVEQYGRGPARFLHGGILQHVVEIARRLARRGPEGGR